MFIWGGLLTRLVIAMVRFHRRSHQSSDRYDLANGLLNSSKSLAPSSVSLMAMMPGADWLVSISRLWSGMTEMPS